MSELLFYSQPVALSREKHKGLHFQPLKHFSFSARVNSVPLNGVEFFEASRDMTVLFNRDEDGRYSPLVLMSLRNSGHDLINEQGEWQGTYVPAFIRRYPFALTADGTVCFDESSGAFGEEGERLFDEEGSNTAMLDRVVQFLRQYDQEAKRTREFCDALADKLMFKPFNVQVVNATRQAVRLEGLYVVDEQVFGRLDDATVGDWFRRGWLAWVYAHLHSIGALGQLSRKLAADAPVPDHQDEQAVAPTAH